MVLVDATATVGGMPLETDRWQLDAVTAGLQKCLSGPPGSAPVTFNERIGAIALRRKHVEQGIRPKDYRAGDGPVVASNYFDLAMLMDYWGPTRLNHHTEATSMLYAARECARLALDEGLDRRFDRHRSASDALGAGLRAMNLSLFGDPTHKMPNVTGVVIPNGIDGDAVRAAMLNDFSIEIGTSFGPLHGRIWRIGTMGYGCRKDNVLSCLAALDATLRRADHAAPPNAAIDAALAVYDAAAD